MDVDKGRPELSPDNAVVDNWAVVVVLLGEEEPSGTDIY